MTMLTLGYVALTGGFAEIITELAVTAVLESLPFPINVIVTSQINPIALVFQFVFFIVLLILIESKR